MRIQNLQKKHDPFQWREFVLAPLAITQEEDPLLPISASNADTKKSCESGFTAGESEGEEQPF